MIKTKFQGRQLLENTADIGVFPYYHLIPSQQLSLSRFVCYSHQFH